MRRGWRTDALYRETGKEPNRDQAAQRRCHHYRMMRRPRQNQQYDYGRSLAHGLGISVTREGLRGSPQREREEIVYAID